MDIKKRIIKTEAEEGKISQISVPGINQAAETRVMYIETKPFILEKLKTLLVCLWFAKQ